MNRSPNAAAVTKTATCNSVMNAKPSVDTPKSHAMGAKAMRMRDMHADMPNVSTSTCPSVSRPPSTALKTYRDGVHRRTEPTTTTGTFSAA